MKVLPSKAEVIELVRSHYGLTLAEAMQVMNSALHPKTLRDDFAMHGIGIPIDNNFLGDFAAKVTGVDIRGTIKSRRPLTTAEQVQMQAEWRYYCADAMLAARLPKTD